MSQKHRKICADTWKGYDYERSRIVKSYNPFDFSKIYCIIPSMIRIERGEIHMQAADFLESGQFDEVGRLPGIEVYEIGKPEWSRDRVRAAEYLFGLILKESWAEGRIPQELWNDGQFLQKHGYVLVEERIIGDVVGYAVTDLAEKYPTSVEVYAGAVERRSPPYLEHFGILTGDGRVISKFGTGHVYIHDLDKVPYHFGSDIYFFRREPNPHL